MYTRPLFARSVVDTSFGTKSASGAGFSTAKKIKNGEFYPKDRLIKAKVLWRKIKEGVITGLSRDAVERDYAKEFKHLSASTC